MKIILKDNIDKAVRKITNFEKRHLPETTAKAINITLFGLRKEMMKQLPKKLVRRVISDTNCHCIDPSYFVTFGG